MGRVSVGEAVASLMRAGSGHRHVRSTGMTVDLMPDGSWEIHNFGELVYVIDLNGNTRVYPNENGCVSKAEATAIRTLSEAVLGREEPLDGYEGEGHGERGLSGDAPQVCGADGAGH